MNVFGSYLLAQVPSWLLASIALWLLYRAHALPAWVTIGLLAVWIIKDLLLFPVMRRFYTPQSPGTGMIGETGTAVTELSPDGFVRVHGELWQAHAADAVPKGARIRVRELRGLIAHVGTAD